MRQQECTGLILPPPAADNEDLRTLLARTALANPSLMQGATDPSEAAARAIEVADRMIEALSKTQLPVVSCLSDEEMRRWEHALVDQEDERRHRDSTTMPAVPPIQRQAIPPLPPHHPRDGDTIPSPMQPPIHNPGPGDPDTNDSSMVG